MKIKKGFVKRKVANMYLVVCTNEAEEKANFMIELNDTASYIWDLVEKGYSVEKIISTVAKEYDIDEEKASGSVNKLIAQMCEQGVIEED